MWARLIGCVVIAGCGYPALPALTSSSDAATGDAGGGDDSRSAATGCFQHWFDGAPGLVLSSPQELVNLSSAGGDRDPWISADGLRLYLDRSPGSHGKLDIYLSTRSSSAAAFPTAVALDNLDTVDNENRAALNADETILMFSSDHATPGARFQLFITKRSDPTQPFASPAPSDQALIANVNTVTAGYFDPFLTGDGLKLYLAPDPDGTALQQITVATRTAADKSFSAGTPVPVINTTGGGDADPAVSFDDRVIVFSSQRPAGAGLGATNLWYATRQRATDDFSAPQLIPNVNSDQDDGDPMLSADGCELYFSSTRRGGNYHLFNAQVTK